MSRKNHRRDYNGRQGSAQRPWEQEQADWQNRGSMQRNQYDNIGRDRYGSNTGQGGGYGSRDWDRGDEQDNRPNWPGEQGGRRYRSQDDAGMSRYQEERSGGYGQNYGDDVGRGASSRGYQGGASQSRDQEFTNWGEGDSEFPRRQQSSQRNFEDGRWDRSQDRSNRGNRGSSQEYNDQAFGGQGARDGGRPWGGDYDFGSPESAPSRGYGSQSSRSSRNTSQGGQHSGRGPKGYRRDDGRIQEDINEELTHHPEIDASEIEVKVSNGEVTLTGTVNNREAKRMAEDCAEGVSGVTDVQNQIRVQKTVGSARTDDDAEASSRGKNRSGASTTSATGSDSGKHRSGSGVSA